MGSIGPSVSQLGTSGSQPEGVGAAPTRITGDVSKTSQTRSGSLVHVLGPYLAKIENVYNVFMSKLIHNINRNIYFLHYYNWELGQVVGETTKNFKIKATVSWCSESTYTIAKQKCAFPDELVCDVWETWKGVNGRGAYRVERDLYPEHRIRADKLHRQHHSDYQYINDKLVVIGQSGRVTETAYGIGVIA